MLFIICISILGNVSASSENQRAPEHTLKTCTQRKGYDIKCEDFVQEKADDGASLWPPGPYVIHMTRHGCPESSVHGWQEGYIDITWQKAQYAHVRISGNQNSFEKVINISKERFFETSDSHMLVSRSALESKFSFCYKVRRNEKEDIGDWPYLEFSIYGTEYGCPEGFVKNYSQTVLPNVSSWDSYGYLPDFELTNNGTNDILELSICTKIMNKQNNSAISGNYDNDAEFIDLSGRKTELFWTSYFLIKYGSTSCPAYTNAIVSKESLYFEHYGNDKDIQTMRFADTFCYYELNTYNDEMEAWLLEKRLKRAYSVNVLSRSEGKHTETEVLWGVVIKRTYRWKVFDLGKTIAVSAVDITSTKETTDVCGDLNVKCYISREKMDFMHKSSVSCKHINVCRLRTFTLSLLFIGVMEGRFIALSVDNDEGDLHVNVYTERVIHDDPSICNNDLGMSDLSINDDQLSASSASLDYTPNKARPLSSGWCSEPNDDLPYIEILFQESKIIEGVTIYDSWETQFDLSKKLRRYELYYQNTFLVQLKNINNSYVLNKTLHFDLSETKSAQRTFWFSKPVTVNYFSIATQKSTISALTCLKFELIGCKQSGLVQHFKTLGYKVSKEVTYVSEIHKDRTILTNIGYPYQYQTNQVHKWLITYPDNHFIKLIFTHIELNVHVGQACIDILKISNHIADSDFVREISQELNGVKESLTMETKESQLILSFETCPFTSTTKPGNGFSSYVTYENIPACFSLRPQIPWQEGLKEICRQSFMLITSMAYLGFRFRQTTEQWTIHIPMKRIHLQIISFYVPCKNMNYNSEFKIIDMEDERIYCNINKPPDNIKSSFDNITIYFYKGIDAWPKLRNVEGFRIVYSVISFDEVQEEDMYINKSTVSKVRNVAINKPITYPSFKYQDGIYSSTLTTDGLTFPESLSCLKIFVLIKPWWFLDLQNVFSVKYIVIFNPIGTHLKYFDYKIIISMGQTVWDLKTVACFHENITPSRVVQVNDETARYVLIEQALESQELQLCEVKVYATEVQEYDSRKEIYIPNIVHGEWGKWSTWSNECLCDGRQYRQRLCNNPVEKFGGQKCPGSNTSGRLCSPLGSNCEDYVEPVDSDSFSRKNSDMTSLSNWSNWSSCSSECGDGLRTRTRTCTKLELTRSIDNCEEDMAESRPCTGTGSCLVCSKKFQKCFSIIRKVTYWNQARLECWTRNMSLVSMASLSEMRFIKYLLRERRNLDVPPTKYFNAEYYVHIGLSIGSMFGSNKTVWENGVTAIFTAWNFDIVSSGKCTRMNFKLYYENNTWEHEACSHKLAEYFMCERKRQGTESVPIKSLVTFVDTELVTIPEQISAQEYTGNVSITITGAPCFNATCRYKYEIETISCRTSEGEWEACSVKLPEKLDSNATDEKYLGTLSNTFSGKVCQRWDQHIPQNHNLDGTMFKGEGISDAANYCRDPGDSGYLWCFTTKSDVQWEPCVLKDVKTERLCLKLREHSVKRNTTITGKPCKAWDKLNDKDTSLSNAAIETSLNYCLDPLNQGYSWCYIDVSSDIEQWEPCQIEEAEIIADEKTFITIDNHFVCNDGKLLSDSLRCNGQFDCESGFDEIDCTYSVHPMINREIGTDNSSRFETLLGTGSFFKCKSDELVSVVTTCDGVIDCFDASDELGCTENKDRYSCSKHQFQCDDGDCIHISQVCNFKKDCIDGSDEFCDFEQCSELTEYQCDNGPCIPLSQRCDAIKHCADGSDEQACDTCQPDIAFHCDIGRCIPLRLTCDEYQHCEDGTDEADCADKVFDSCQEVWESGYRKSGSYKIIDNQRWLQCMFDEMDNATIKTVFHFDLYVYSFTLGFFRLNILILYDNPTTSSEVTNNNVYFHRDGTRCIQQFKSVCTPSYESMSRLNSSLPPCVCTVHNIEMPEGIVQRTEACKTIADKNWTIHHEYYTMDDNLLSFHNTLSYRGIEIGPLDFLKAEKSQIIPGPVICKQELVFKAEDEDFVCDVNGKHIPKTMRCIHDIDETGFPTGCRDGSHLNNCEHFECPRSMAKCPFSYCIPQRFLCDGLLQCPGGEDEQSCSCNPSRNEILIIHDEETTTGPDIFQFARQLLTPTNIVRVLSYKATQPFQAYGINNMLLDVTDKEISRTLDTDNSFDCGYKIMAKDLLDSIHFTNNGLRGVILFQTKGIAEGVNKEIADAQFFKEQNTKVYRVLENSNVSSYSKTSSSGKVLDINVRRWNILHDIGAEYFSNLCNVTTKIHCLGGYKCAWSHACLMIDQVCDGKVNCPHGDDEAICGFRCPDNCTCHGYVADCSSTGFQLSLLPSVPDKTRYLDLSSNTGLRSILEKSNLDMQTLIVLNLSFCGIQRLNSYSFGKIRNIRHLDLSYNLIEILRDFVFNNLQQIKVLNLRGNYQLSVIEMYAFTGLVHVKELDLANAKLETILANTFSGMILRRLDLSNNKLKELANFAFRGAFIQYINFKENDVELFNTEIFVGLTGLEELITPGFKFCCIRPNYVKEENCYPQKDEFSSCDDLMRHSVLQFLIWLIGIMAFLGNILTILYRLKYDRERLKLGFGIFVTNLAVADFIMALYLIIIAVADSAFRKRYIFMDDYWRHSFWCNLAGIMSTVSSEASVLFLCLITLDRLLVIKFPFGRAKLSKDKAVLCSIFTWLFSVTVAIFPVAYEKYFKNQFYSKSGVCIALPLTRDRPPGWVYSLSIFVCLNFLTFILVAFGQLSIFNEVRNYSGMATSVETSRKRDLKVARNLLLVVATDFMCWFPIGVMAIFALSGHVVSGEVYAWAAVFILPVNSALNPILYTLSAIIGGTKFRPSTDEQSLKQITAELGENTIKCLNASSRFTKSIRSSNFQDITMISDEVELPTMSILSICWKLTQTLDGLHSCCLDLRLLDNDSLFACVRNNKITGSLRIKSEPFISYKPEDKMERIKHLGVIIKGLLLAREKHKTK